MRHPSCPLCSGSYVPLPRFDHIELVQCCGCEVIFSPRIPSNEELAKHYAGYNRDHSRNNEPSIKRREELLDRFESWRSLGRVLDVGCGVGFLLDQARDRGWETFGTEYTPEAVELCREHGHQMFQGPLSGAELEPESFDLIIYTEVIEHIYNQNEEFDLVHSLLRPGGLLYVTTPNIDSLSCRILGDRWTVIDYPEHLVYFSPRTLTSFLATKNFDPVWMEATGISPSRFVSGLRRWADSPAPSGKAPKASDPAARKVSLDQRLRNRISKSRSLTMMKDGVDRALTTTSLGDAIKAGYVKRSKISR